MIEWTPNNLLTAAFAALLLLTAFDLFYRRRIAKINAEQLALYERRAQRVRQALAGPSSEFSPLSDGIAYPFSGFVELLDDGRIKIAGQTFATDQPLEIIARDKTHIERATVTSTGNGAVFIISLGQKFRVSFKDGAWDVQPVSVSLDISRVE